MVVKRLTVTDIPISYVHLSCILGTQVSLDRLFLIVPTVYFRYIYAGKRLYKCHWFFLHRLTFNKIVRCYLKSYYGYNWAWKPCFLLTLIENTLYFKQIRLSYNS